MKNKNILLLKNFITLTLMILLNFSIFELVKGSQAIIQISVLMASISISICLLYTVSLYRAKKYRERKQEEDKLRLREIVKSAYEGNYDPLNSFLQSDESKKLMMQLGFFLTQHFNGDWIDESKLVIPEEFSSNLISGIKSYFKNPVNYEDLNNDIEISTFLWTVYPDRMNKVLSSIN